MALHDPKLALNPADLAAWARTKPTDEIYTYSDSAICVVAQYGQARGRADLSGLDSDALNDLFPGLRDIANPRWPELPTFGGFAARLGKAMADRAHDARVSR